MNQQDDFFRDFSVLSPILMLGGIACKNLGRKFIGIEKDEKYFEIANNRIKTA